MIFVIPRERDGLALLFIERVVELFYKRLGLQLVVSQYRNRREGCSGGGFKETAAGGFHGGFDDDARFLAAQSISEGRDAETKKEHRLLCALCVSVVRFYSKMLSSKSGASKWPVRLLRYSSLSARCSASLASSRAMTSFQSSSLKSRPLRSMSAWPGT